MSAPPKRLAVEHHASNADESQRLRPAPVADRRSTCVAEGDGDAMFARSLFETPDMIRQHEILERIAALIDAGILRTTLG
jgi:hypothetical protein